MKLSYIIAIIPLIISCTGNNESVDIVQKRDNVIDVSGIIKEFHVDDVLIGSNALINGSENHLYILDTNSTDKFISVFSLPDGKFVGRFMKFGAGPNEVAVPENINVFTSHIDGREKALVIDHGNLRTMSFDVDSAITDSAYISNIYRPLDPTTRPSHFIYINDTLGFARKIIIDENTGKFSQALGKYNLITGELTDFAPNEHIKDNRSLFAADTKHNTVAEVGSNIDLVVLYDFEGNVKKRIKGPGYKSAAEGSKAYFSSVEIAGNYILGVYSGGDWNTNYLGKRIEVWDNDGNYIASLTIDKPIRDLFYHSPSGLLYLSLIDDMQFATLNLEEALSKATEQHKSETDPLKVADKKSVAQHDSYLQMCFLSEDLTDTLTRFDMGEIVIPRELSDDKHELTNSILLSTNNATFPADQDTVRFNISKTTPPQIEVNIPINWLVRRMFTLVDITIPQDMPEGKFEGHIELSVKNYSQPTILPFSGTVVRQ